MPATDRRPTQGLSYGDWIQAAIAGKVPPPPVAELVGFRITNAGDGKATAELDAGERHWNPMGTVHGGILTDVADAAMGTALGAMLDEGETFTTLELSMRFVRPVWEGTITVAANVVKKGRTIALVDCDLTDEKDRLVARGTSTCMILRGDAAKGR